MTKMFVEQPRYKFCVFDASTLLDFYGQKCIFSLTFTLISPTSVQVDFKSVWLLVVALTNKKSYEIRWIYGQIWKIKNFETTV